MVCMKLKLSDRKDTFQLMLHSGPVRFFSHKTFRKFPWFSLYTDTHDDKLA